MTLDRGGGDGEESIRSKDTSNIQSNDYTTDWHVEGQRGENIKILPKCLA